MVYPFAKACAVCLVLSRMFFRSNIQIQLVVSCAYYSSFDQPGKVPASPASCVLMKAKAYCSHENFMQHLVCFASPSSIRTCILIGIRRGLGGGAPVAACEQVVIFFSFSWQPDKPFAKKSYCLLYWFLCPTMSSTTTTTSVKHSFVLFIVVVHTTNEQ